MKHDKEQLNKLYDFLCTIIDDDGNKWFVDKLKNKLEINTQSFDHSASHKVDLIEKYLGLDYEIDEFSSIFDYSFVKQEYVRDELICDNREMLRYRLGVRSHKADFGEFCKFAIFQVEMLLNYFYMEVTSNNFESIKQRIINYNKRAIISEKITKVGEIALAVKIFAYCNEFQSSVDFKIQECIDILRNIRNMQSHRSPSEIKDWVREGHIKLNNYNFPISPRDGFVDYYSLDEDSQIKFKNEVLASKWYKDYKTGMYLTNMPFSLVLIYLRKFIDSMRSNLLAIS